MDILTHTLSGTAIATCTATFLHKKNFFKILLAGSLGGFFPDIDAISLWSRFDQTFGNIFNLKLSGNRIYFSKLWYSHHNFFHSIIAGILISILLGTIIYLIKIATSWQKEFSLLKSYKKNLIYILTFFMGFMIHLFEDMITPGSVWDGINMFFPSKNFIGGYGKIWWWNNYDIFLIVVIVILLNTIIYILNKIKPVNIKFLTSMVILLSTLSITYQINTRGFNFSYKGFTKKYHEYEKKSLAIQKKILGSKLYDFMYSFDKTIKIYF